MRARNSYEITIVDFKLSDHHLRNQGLELENDQIELMMSYYGKSVRG